MAAIRQPSGDHWRRCPIGQGAGRSLAAWLPAAVAAMVKSALRPRSVEICYWHHRPDSKSGDDAVSEASCRAAPSVVGSMSRVGVPATPCSEEPRAASHERALPSGDNWGLESAKRRTAKSLKPVIRAVEGGVSSAAGDRTQRQLASERAEGPDAPVRSASVTRWYKSNSDASSDGAGAASGCGRCGGGGRRRGCWCIGRGRGGWRNHVTRRGRRRCCQ